MRQSMTYGTVPAFEAFSEAFHQECPHGSYRITHGLSQPSYAPDAGEYDDVALYQEIERLTRRWEAGNEDAGNWASSILETLGFEWV